MSDASNFNPAAGILSPATEATPGALSPTLVGPPGPQGPPGPPGLQGEPGADSIVPGPVGPEGPQGLSIVGPAGPQGAQGPVGAESKVPGPRGPQGVAGPVGPVSTVPGPQGLRGPAGIQLRYGDGPPQDSVGTEGEFYVDNAATYLYGPKGTSQWPRNGISLIGPASTIPGPAGKDGEPGAVGPPGDPGARGPGLLSGTDNPTVDVGEPGDFFLNTATHILYGPYDYNQGWPSTGVSIVGPAGTSGVDGKDGAAGPAGADSTVPGPAGTAGKDGATIRTGGSAPTATIGNDGDYFINTANNGLYGPKANGAWPTTFVSLVGPPGASGTNGVNGATILSGAGTVGVPPGPGIGKTGDFWLDTTNALLYGPKGISDYPSTPLRLVGPQGVAGTNGTNGNTVLNGTGAPTASVGNNGDFYFDTASDVMWGPKAAGAWPANGVSIIGPAGPQGIQGPQGNVGNDPTANSLTVYPISGDVNPAGVYVKTALINGTTLAALDQNGVVRGTALTVSGSATVTNLILASGGSVTYPDGTTQNTASGASTGSGGTGTGTGAVAATSVEHVGPFGLATSGGTAKGVNGGTWTFVPETTVSLTGLSWFASATSSATVTPTMYSLPINNGQAAGTVVQVFPAVTVPTTGSGFVQKLTTPITLSPSYIYYMSFGASVSITVNGYIVIAEATTGTTAAPSAPSFTATSNGTTAAPAYSYTNQVDTGWYLKTASTTSAMEALAVNGVDVIRAQKGAGFVTGDWNVSGTAYQNGPVITQGTTTLYGATSASATITSSTPSGTPSFVSTQGFKQVVDMGIFWPGSSGTAMSTAYTFFIRPIVNTPQSAYSGVPATFVPAYSGSVMGLSVYQYNPLVSGQSVTFCVYIGGVATAFAIQGSSTTGPATYYQVAAKGTYSFAPGQAVQVFIKGSTTAITAAFSAQITVEMGA